ncbi:T-cell differentiation antigen CD6-like isoform X1 [Tachysurus vachellii]|uniref:T-cell differentiation antigen CD6-like isoform X1 n=1 Tax=Tachysurus vachellii TaxID=175792 RepID=UPI00296B14CC|nr:T-cell differentiation antigen CD6-like isoform X1 [Tachysurus vachellii]
MESLLMVVVLHALFLHQGLHGAAISSNENGTDTRRSDDVEKRSTGGSLHTASISKHCSETLMALHHGRWVSVTLTQQSNETKKDMAQFCKDLDCGGIFAENGTASMNTCLSDCTIINSNLYNCTDAAPDNCSNVVEVVCAWQVVQLIGGSDRCAGRVELFGHGGWGSVCDDGWDLKGGNVVCAQLDCGTALRVMGKDGDFEAGSGPIHINHINCSGTERNLWQCSTKMNRGRNYCGHKEDASVVCSGSSYIPVTTVNTLMTDVTNWTTVLCCFFLETVTVVAAEDNSSGISPPVLGCIVLSVTLLLLMLSNAGQCAYYKRQNGGLESRSASQALQQDNSETSSDSENENYYNPDPTPPTAVNNYEHNLVDYSRDTNQEQTRFCEGRNAVQTNALDSESTSSGECYENIEPVMENLLSPDINPEYCIQMTPLHNNSESANNGKDDSFDSDSTSSGECYENTVEEGPSLPEQPPLVHPLPHLAGNSSVSQPYSPDQDDSSTSSEEPYENVAEIDNSYFARSEQSVNSSSDSDYDDVGNW